MKISDIAVPEIYRSSSDFRFFLKWFELAMERVKHDTENIVDLYDPLRCPEQLLWMLGDTVGYRYDNRLPAAYNRLVLLYFMSMIRHKGSKDGVTLAAEVNLAQFNVLEYGKQKDILHNRLEDTSIPVNSVYVTSHTAEGYIEVVYFAENKPIDACLEYVRPLGMYLFDHAGVRYDSRTKISVDARLTNSNELNTSVGPTRVGHYRREDYARLQKTKHRVSTDHVDENGMVSWDATFAEMGDMWVTSATPVIENSAISTDVGEEIEWTLSLNPDNSWNIADINGVAIGCAEDNSITTLGGRWIFTQVAEDQGRFTISTGEESNTFYLASNQLEGGRFRGYLQTTLDENPSMYQTRFSFYRFESEELGYVLIEKTSELIPGRYVIMTELYVLSVMDNSGVVVQMGTGQAAVPAVNARDTQTIDYSHRRSKTYYRNSDAEYITSATVNAGHRALHTLQLSNNEHIVRANLPTIFGLRNTPESDSSGSLSISTHEAAPVTRRTRGADLFDRVPWNLAYDKLVDEANTLSKLSAYGQPPTYDVSVVRGGTPEAPVPAVNPAMRTLGDAMSMGEHKVANQSSPTGVNKFYTSVIYEGDERSGRKISIVDPKNPEDSQ